MRHRNAPSATYEGYSSSSSTSPTTRQRGFERPRARRPSRTPHDEPSLLGSVGKLVRLAVFALVLALVVPYVKSHLFGGPKGGSGVVVKNATLNQSKNPYNHQHRGEGERGEGERREREEVDVFNFSHSDYLAAREKSARQSGVVASASPSAVVSKPAQSPKQKQQKGGGSRSNSKSRPDNRYNDIDDDDDDHSPPPSSSSNSASLALRLLAAIPSTLLLTLRFLTIPIHHLFRLLSSLFSSLYQLSRLTLSHFLRPILHLLAPLTYLLSGVLFIFVYTPFNLLSAIVTELYPVYIFLGAATVVGLAMGVAAAGVLYLSAFVFVDRVPSDQMRAGGVKRTKAHEQDRESGEERGYFDTRSTGRQSYDARMYGSPMVSPTTPYRPSKRGERMAYQGYSGVPGSSLRASVG